MSHGVGPASWALHNTLQTCEPLPRPGRAHPIGLFFVPSLQSWQPLSGIWSGAPRPHLGRSHGRLWDHPLHPYVIPTFCAFASSAAISHALLWAEPQENLGRPLLDFANPSDAAAPRTCLLGHALGGATQDSGPTSCNHYVILAGLCASSRAPWLRRRPLPSF